MIGVGVRIAFVGPGPVVPTQVVPSQHVAPYSLTVMQTVSPCGYANGRRLVAGWVAGTSAERHA